ncbi:hypothetical protein [Nocardia amamiensis]|uniref:hypothetical protein n=1 Tax=Nocardia amamiensis TaxID=404578 RepID=UPI0033D47168
MEAAPNAGYGPISIVPKIVEPHSDEESGDSFRARPARYRCSRSSTVALKGPAKDGSTVTGDASCRELPPATAAAAADSLSLVSRNKARSRVGRISVISMNGQQAAAVSISDFYVPPPQIPSEPGAIIRTQPMSLFATAPTDTGWPGEAQHVMYTTRLQDGSRSR